MREAAALEAFARRLMAEHGDAITRLCFLYLGNQMDAQDAAQESFLKALGAYQDFRGRSSERTWLTRIAINTCKDMLKSAWQQVEGLIERHYQGTLKVEAFIEELNQLSRLIFQEAR